MYFMQVSRNLFSFSLINYKLIFRRNHTPNSESTKEINWSFAPSTGNSSLRSHLESVHKMEYLQLCAANGWTIMLPKMRKEMMNANQGSGGGDGTQRPAYSQGQLLKSIVSFVVADDQVRLMLCQKCTLNNLYCSQSMS